MKKFIALLKKELKELLTLQMLLPMLIGVVFFVFIGNIAGSETKKANAPQNIAVADLDGTVMSRSVSETLRKQSFIINDLGKVTEDEAISKAKEKGISTLLLIPEGFEKDINEFKPQKVQVYSIVKNFSVTGMMGSKVVTAVLASMNDYISDQLIMKKASTTDPQFLKNPVEPENHVVIADKKAQINPEDVMGFITSQTTFLPIIMFLIIIFAAQMVAVTIASEKENKTLETLLSTPISRVALVNAKMLAAGIVSLLMAVLYMFGFSYYMKGFVGDAMNAPATSSSRIALQELGLSLHTTDYVVLGVSVFMSILIALAISLILGAFAEDVRKAQGLMAPMSLLIMIPYFLTMFMDLNSASIGIRLLVYAIPFSHPFIAAPNLILNRFDMVIYGILYQAAVFAVFVFIATRIFSTDKILTMKINFKRGRLTFGKS